MLAVMVNLVCVCLFVLVGGALHDPVGVCKE